MSTWGSQGAESCSHCRARGGKVVDGADGCSPPNSNLALCGLSPCIPSCPQDSQPHCALCLSSAWPGPEPLGGSQEGKSCGSETALIWVSSAAITPTCSPSTVPRRTTGGTTGPSTPGSPQTATPRSGGECFCLFGKKQGPCAGGAGAVSES